MDLRSGNITLDVSLPPIVWVPGNEANNAGAWNYGLQSPTFAVGFCHQSQVVKSWIPCIFYYIAQVTAGFYGLVNLRLVLWPQLHLVCLLP